MNSDLAAGPQLLGATIMAELRRGTKGGRSHVEGVTHEPAIEVDSDGSLVSLPAAEWFVCFVPGLRRQWWHRFMNAKHQHVFAMRMVDDFCWILVEPWWTRMLVSVLTLDEAIKFLRWGAAGDILQVREAVPGRGDQVHGWSNCAVLIAFLLGRSYRTWTPHGLYRRLVAERGARPVYLAQWLANALKPTPRHKCVAASRSDIHRQREGCLEVAEHACQRTPPLSSSTSRPSHQERETKRAHDHLTSGSPFIERRSGLNREIAQHVAG